MAKKDLNHRQREVLVDASRHPLGLVTHGDRCTKKALRDRGYATEDEGGDFFITDAGRQLAAQLATAN